MRLAGRLRGLLLAAALVFAVTVQAFEAPPPLKVMTFNVRVPVDDDGNRWELRREGLARAISDAAPDLLATQELVQEQGGFIVERLPAYAWFGRGRRGDAGDARDEHMGVFYRRDSMRLLDSGDFWLSDTHCVAGSTGWGNLYPRMVTWGLFERIADRRRLYLLNTHLPYREEDAAVRERMAAAIVAWITDLPAQVPVVLAGDFNDDPDSATHAVLRHALQDAWLQASQRGGPEGTFHGFTGIPGGRIDWILSRGLQPLRARTLAGSGEGPHPSDHFPVLVEFD